MRTAEYISQNSLAARVQTSHGRDTSDTDCDVVKAKQTTKELPRTQLHSQTRKF